MGMLLLLLFLFSEDEERACGVVGEVAESSLLPSAMVGNLPVKLL